MLWLLRHADAADGVPDDSRPLTDKGIRQARAAGRALANLEVELDLCLCSPKRRALETAELACEPLGVPVSVTPELAGGPFDAEQLAAGLGEVILIGHDPSFSRAVHDLTGAHARMSKAGLAAIRKGELVLLLRPRELELIAAARRLAGTTSRGAAAQQAGSGGERGSR